MGHAVQRCPEGRGATLVPRPDGDLPAARDVAHDGGVHVDAYRDGRVAARESGRRDDEVVHRVTPRPPGSTGTPAAK
jgi:hypothetical protein